MRVDIREAVPLGKFGGEVRDAVRVHQLAILVGGYVGGEFVAQHTAVGGLLRLPEFQNLFSIYQTVLECAIIAEQEGAEADEKKLSE